jgi:hypothetical protein
VGRGVVVKLGAAPDAASVSRGLGQRWAERMAVCRPDLAESSAEGSDSSSKPAGGQLSREDLRRLACASMTRSVHPSSLR